MTEEKLNPIHPGEVLLEEFLKPMELSQHRLALSIGVDSAVLWNLSTVLDGLTK
jgi:addiction module HigA family antidote